MRLRPPVTGHRSLAAASRALAGAGLALTVLLYLAPAAAQAANTRNFDTSIAGFTPPGVSVAGPFHNPSAVAVDASGNAFIADEGTGVISEYDPFGGYLSQLSTRIVSRSIAVDRATGELYVDNDGDNGPEAISVFDSSGDLLRHIAFGIPQNGEIRVALDNSGGAGGPGEGEQGRLYLTYNAEAAGVYALDPNGNPVDFSAHEEYISANEIIGTPAGKFEQRGGPVATDSHGDVYFLNRVNGENTAVYEFAPSGTFVREFTDAEVPGGFRRDILGIAVDPISGNLLVASGGFEEGFVIDEFSPVGIYLGQIDGPSSTESFGALIAVAFSSTGYLYAAEGVSGGQTSKNLVRVFLPLGVGPLPQATTEAASGVERTTVTLHGKAELNGGGKITDCHFEYAGEGDYKPWAEPEPYTGLTSGAVPCLNEAGETVGTESKPIESTTEVHAPMSGIRAQTTYHYRISLTNHVEIPKDGEDEQFTTFPAVTGVKTLPATGVTNVSAVLHGSFTGEEFPTTYHFEYTSEGEFQDHGYRTAIKVPVSDANAPSGTGEVLVPPIEATGLEPDTAYRYRLVATNKLGSTQGESLAFKTDQAPTIEGFSTSHLTTTSVHLEARINPQGFSTECYFEYGPTTLYGSVASCSKPLEGSSGVLVAVPIEGLHPGVTYHFRVVAKSVWGTVTSEDQTFEFFPPSCPNAAVRQQTGSSYLPDCRAYELVSPSNANGTLFYAGGPSSATATNPSRLAFTGLYGAIPGVNAIDTGGDLYVSTRTDSGWTTRYVGLPGSEAACMGGPPNDALSHLDDLSPPYLTDSIIANPAMSKLVIWLDGTAGACILGLQDVSWDIIPPSNAPYVFNADGSVAERLPTNFPGESGDVERALKCPYSGEAVYFPTCSSEVAPSGDLSHLFFSSNTTSFAPGGLTSAPGSAYDDDIGAQTVQLISLKPNGENISQDPVFANTPPNTSFGRVEVTGGAEESLRFPAVSTDGSHVLISTATTGTSTCDTGGQALPNPCPRYIENPIHLYMRVGGGTGGVSYVIAENPSTHEPAAVRFVGMTPDGSEVFFTSEEHLTSEDPEHVGASLYVWHEANNTVKLISRGPSEAPGAAGNTGDCRPATIEKEGGVGAQPWTSACSAVPISTYRYSWLTGGAGGNGFSDSAMSKNGEIYFYSPEQLDGAKGVPGEQNLYEYREGAVHLVATLKPLEKCTPTSYNGQDTLCTTEPILRIDVSPDGSHMAFVTASQLTSYDNAGHLEMYTYTPSGGSLICDSCNPSGRPATADVQASEDGLFMANDGRTFFSTTESLDPQDTNEEADVYEFVNGRAQLITPGTGTNGASALNNLIASTEIPGLVGVSADGTNVYFGTFDSLTSEDQNGSFFKFYDARSDGGFPQAAPPQPCAAAEECHGPSTENPQLPPQGTVSNLAGGNVEQRGGAAHGKGNHKERSRHKRHRRRHRTRSGGSR